MGELRVDGNTDDFGVTFFKFLQAMIEGNQFGRADKGKIKRPEEYNSILSFEIAWQSKIFVDGIVTHDGDGSEIGSWFSYKYGHFFSPVNNLWGIKDATKDKLSYLICQL